MSIDAIKWAFDLERLDPGPKFTLVALANRADEEGYVYPSIRWMGKRTGYAPSTVRQHLRVLEEAGLLAKQIRIRDDGGQSSNLYRLSMAQPGLRLGEATESAPPPPDSVAPPSRKRKGAPPDSGGELTLVPGASGAISKPHTQEKTKDETKRRAVPAEASPVAALFAIYRKGILERHQAEYPPSATANGILAKLVKRLGTEAATATVRYYLASQKPYYLTRKHALEVLAKDATELWLEVQARSGARTAAAVPTKASAWLVFEGGQTRQLQDYEPGDHLDIARRARREYSVMIAKCANPHGIAVQLGTERREYSLEDLRP